MENLRDIKDYSTFKAALDTEMKKSVESFVHVGYLLRKAMDTDILHESGYKSVVEFAQAEYNIGKDQVSRFVAINERFSVGGYSEELQEQYQKFGLAKLQEMLQLPDNIIKELSPELTRSDIQEIKKELREEEKKTDIEVMLEPQEAAEYETLSKRSMYVYFRDHTEAYEKMYKIGCENLFHKQTAEQILDVIAPSGAMAECVRVSGLGKIMLTVKAEDNTMTFTNMRNGEKETAELTEILKDFIDIFRPMFSKGAKEVWQQVYKEEYPVKETQKPQEEKPEKAQPFKTWKEKVAPVQPDKKEDRAAVNNSEKNKQDKTKEKSNETAEQNTEAQETEKAINTECGSQSTPPISTSDITDHEGIVFNEMIGVANGLLTCVYKKDIEGIQEHLTDMQHMLDSLAADKKKDIQGQISMFTEVEE